MDNFWSISRGGRDAEGKLLLIKNVDVFQSDVLPKYFKHSKIQSFIRQLHIYDFHKASTVNPNHIGYANALFRKSRPELLSQMKRKPPLMQQRSLHKHSMSDPSLSLRRDSCSSDDTLEDGVDCYVMSPASVRTSSDESLARVSIGPTLFNEPSSDALVEGARRKVAFEIFSQYLMRANMQPEHASFVLDESPSAKRARREEELAACVDLDDGDEDFRRACRFEEVGPVPLHSITHSCSLDLGDELGDL